MEDGDAVLNRVHDNVEASGKIPILSINLCCMLLLNTAPKYLVLPTLILTFDTFCLDGRSFRVRESGSLKRSPDGQTNPFSVPTESERERVESLCSAKPRHPFAELGQSKGNLGSDRISFQRCAGGS